ncbi:MAG: hypothetical protein M0R80_04850 [Proteobacteria bacterium]|nr:hypothetical protein [Pseudomonadota bacterium]
MRAQSLLVAGLVAVCLAFAAAGCDKEAKDYSCEDVAEKMYDEDCEMWCQNDGYNIYVDTCA